MKLTGFDATKIIFATLLAIWSAGLNAAENKSDESNYHFYSVDDFASDWDVKGMKISPDGKHLVFTVPYDDQVIFVTSEFADDGLKPVASIPFSEDSYPINPLWVNSDRIVFTLRSKTKVRGTKHMIWSTRLFAIDRNGENFLELRTDGSKTDKSMRQIHSADVISILKEDSDHILVGKSRSNSWLRDLYNGVISDVHKLNFYTGELTLYMKAPRLQGIKFNDWHSDHRGHIRFGFGETRKGDSVMVIRGRGEDDWQILSENELFEEGKFAPLQFGAGDNEFYVLSSLATGRMAVYRFDIASGQLAGRVYEHDEVDVTGIVYSFEKGKVVAANYNQDGGKIVYFDDEYGRVRRSINNALDQATGIHSISEDEKGMIVMASSPKDAGAYYYYDVDGGRMSFLGSLMNSVAPDHMGEMSSVSYDTRDGLTINAILTLPKSHSADAPPPAIILPHSNPKGRDTLAWDSTAQFLANRGYVVLQPNYRGSSGFGSHFRGLGRGEWGRDMQNDLADGAEWLIDSGLAKEGRVCIVGRGYAGYAAIMGLAKDKDLFACGVARNAPTDIAAMLRDANSFNTKDSYYAEVAGELEKKELDQISPIKQIANIEAPIFIYHRDGSNYDVKHSRRFAKQLEKHGTNFDYREIKKLKPGQLHDPIKANHDFLTALEAWLYKVNPTPELARINEDGNLSSLPEMKQSNW